MAPRHLTGRLPRRLFIGSVVLLLMCQTFVGFMGAGDRFVLGHNGWNSSAYLQAARNSLRWGALFPVQYYTGRTPPKVRDGYTHHPLGMHLHNVLSVALFGDHEGSIRAVPAFFGVLALLALLLVVRLLYDDRIALIAGAIFVLNPTNAIYTNMSNHENGFIFWTLLWGYAYLRFLRARLPEEGAAPTGRWLPFYGLMLFAFFWAAMWDWPAYYAALVVALHWLSLIVSRFLRAGKKVAAIAKDLGLLAAFAGLVLALFVGHFLLVTAVVGSLSELGGVFEARQLVSRTMLLNHLKVVPILMFTLPILLIAGGWFCYRGWQALRGRLARRDLLALTFAIAGFLHYYIFRGTAVIHEFWGWTLVPFVSIACAFTLVTACDRARAFVQSHWPRHQRLLGASVIAVLALSGMGDLAYRYIDLVPRGRAVGGSLWFVEHTRPVLERYRSTREMIRFAAQVKDKTTRRVGVLVDPAFQNLWGYEPRFPITLDREVVFQSVRSPPPDQLGVSEGWVYLAPPQVLSEHRLVELLATHPVLLYDDFVMVDLRRHETELRVIKNEPCERTFLTWYWNGPWADAVAPVRQPDEEARLLAAVRDLRARQESN